MNKRIKLAVIITPIVALAVGGVIYAMPDKKQPVKLISQPAATSQEAPATETQSTTTEALSATPVGQSTSQPSTATSTTTPEPKATKTITAAWTDSVEGNGKKKMSCRYSFDDGTVFSESDINKYIDGDVTCMKVGDQVPINYGQ